MFEVMQDDLKKIEAARFFRPEQISGQEALGLSIDSRTIGMGEIFWALRGEQFDGHSYLKEVASKALLTVINNDTPPALIPESLPYIKVPDTLRALQELAGIQRAKYSIPVIAITGSNGKTTTKEMLYHILNQKMITHKTNGNFNNHIGCPLTLLNLNSKHQAAVIELGSNHPGEIRTIAKITDPLMGIITNIGGAHLEFFASEQALAQEKLSLFEHVNKDGLLIKNLDEKYIAGHHNTLKSVSYALEHEADVTAQIISFNDHGYPLFALNSRTEIQLQIAGKHNVSNALGAAAAALQLNFSEDEIKAGLESFLPYNQRVQIQTKRGIIFINDAYNANPVSMEAAFNTADAMNIMGKKYFALGDMLELGDQSLKLHQALLLSALKDPQVVLLLLGEQMRSAAKLLKEDLLNRVSCFKNHANMGTFLNQQAKAGDLVLIKGSRALQMEKILREF